MAAQHEGLDRSIIPCIRRIIACTIATVSTTCRKTHFPVPITFAASASWLLVGVGDAAAAWGQPVQLTREQRFEEDS